MGFRANIKTIIEVYEFWNWSNRSWLLEHPEIHTHQTHRVLDEFIEIFKNINNRILREYLPDDEILTLNYGQCCVKIEDNKATIFKLNGF